MDFRDLNEVEIRPRMVNHGFEIKFLALDQLLKFYGKSLISLKMKMIQKERIKLGKDLEVDEKIIIGFHIDIG